MGLLFSSPEDFNYDQELFNQKKILAAPYDDGQNYANSTMPYRYCAQDFKFPGGNLVNTPFPAEEEPEPVYTIWQSFTRAVGKFPNNNCVGARTYLEQKDDNKKGPGPRGDFVWQSFNEAHEEVLTVASGLLSLGLKKGDTVGLCAQNRPEWTLTALGLYSQGLVTVALYDTLGEDAVEYIMGHAETSVVFASPDKVKTVLSAVGTAGSDSKMDTTCVKYVVQFDSHPKWTNAHETISEANKKLAESKGVQLLGYSELLARGRAAMVDPNPPSNEDLAFIMYTSGTTGPPKGVMLTHNNLISCVSGVFYHKLFSISGTDRMISYLPLAHIFETVMQVAMFLGGGAIGFFGGNIKELIDDIKLLKPTILPGVPRVFSRIYDRVMALAEKSGLIKSWYFRKAYYDQCYRLRRGQPLNEAHDQKVFSVVRGRLGLEELRIVVTGAAPCPPYLMEFLRCVLRPKVGVAQGYGMTETSAAVSVSFPSDHCLGHVGPPLVSAEIRLVDVPEMNYLSSSDPPCGEVVCRGPSIFQGYYKNDEETKSTLVNGWCHTGDIGRFNPNGTLSIIDRKKNIFKTSLGEYIASDKVEGLFERHQFISQCFIYGNSYKPFIVGVVVPDTNYFIEAAREKGWWTLSADTPVLSPEFIAHFKEVVTRHQDDIAAFLLDRLNKFADEFKLRSFEKPKDLYVVSVIDGVGNGFTVENDMLTPTMKKRRPYILKTFKEQIMAMYTKHGEAPKADERW